MNSHKPRAVRVAIVGLGAIAERNHLPEFARTKGAQIAALVSARPSALRRLGGSYGVEQRYAHYRDVVTRDDIDALVICTTNDSHAEIAEAALSHGKHVLVEKPITTRLQDAVALVALAKKQRRVLHVHHNLRFTPTALAAARVLAGGRIGRVVAFEALLSHQGPRGWAPHAAWFFDPARVGGGVLMDLGVHAFDLLRYWLGDEARAVVASAQGAARKADAGAAHHASCLVEFRAGASGSVTVSWRDGVYRNCYYFIGEKAALSVDLASGELALHKNGQTRNVPVPAAGERAPSAQRAFIAAIRGDLSHARGAASGDDGASALELALAAQQSIADTRWLDLGSPGKGASGKRRRPVR
jgi:predicted dehydrogenase